MFMMTTPCYLLLLEEEPRRLRKAKIDIYGKVRGNLYQESLW